MSLKEKNDFRLSYYEMGQNNAPTLLFIHGNSSSKEVFKNQLEYFSKLCHVISVDLPGHGNSSTENEASSNPHLYSIDYFSDILKNFVSGKELNNIILIGHSFGGHIAIDLAKKIQDKLVGLYIINASPLETLDDISKAFNPIAEVGTLFKKVVTDEEILALKNIFLAHHEDINFEKTFKDTDPIFRENLFNSIQSNTQIGERSFLKSLQVPIVLSYSTNERILSESYIKSLKEELDNIEYIDLLIEGHFPQLIAPDKINEFLQLFVDSSINAAHTQSSTF